MLLSASFSLESKDTAGSSLAKAVMLMLEQTIHNVNPNATNRFFMFSLHLFDYSLNIRTKNIQM